MCKTYDGVGSRIWVICATKKANPSIEDGGNRTGEASVRMPLSASMQVTMGRSKECLGPQL